METALSKARKEFLAFKADQQTCSMQRVALQIIAGVDMNQLLNASTEEKKSACGRLNRLIERERLRGVNGHWSYDLNRHIALKQALDRLTAKVAGTQEKSQFL
ncbi:cytoplasmic protein [Ochrobactrum sp. Marseille-Q0166]|nr:cytoplasmic protein [Ochrobactrum sp. Marseille-Q0166]